MRRCGFLLINIPSFMAEDQFADSLSSETDHDGFIFLKNISHRLSLETLKTTKSFVHCQSD